MSPIFPARVLRVPFSRRRRSLARSVQQRPFFLFMSRPPFICACRAMPSVESAAPSARELASRLRPCSSNILQAPCIRHSLGGCGTLLVTLQPSAPPAPVLQPSAPAGAKSADPLALLPARLPCMWQCRQPPIRDGVTTCLHSCAPQPTSLWMATHRGTSGRKPQPYMRHRQLAPVTSPSGHGDGMHIRQISGYARPWTGAHGLMRRRLFVCFSGR